MARAWDRDMGVLPVIRNIRVWSGRNFGMADKPSRTMSMPDLEHARVTVLNSLASAGAQRERLHDFDAGGMLLIRARCHEMALCITLIRTCLQHR